MSQNAAAAFTFGPAALLSGSCSRAPAVPRSSAVCLGSRSARRLPRAAGRARTVFSAEPAVRLELQGTPVGIRGQSVGDASAGIRAELDERAKAESSKAPLVLETEIIVEEDEDEDENVANKLNRVSATSVGDFDNPSFECPYPNDKIKGGRITFDEQVAIAKRLTADWEYDRLMEVYERKRLFGMTPRAEVINGRVAMLGLLLGWLTERITGFTFLEQIGLGN
eukprot:tig00021319_g20251.t1